MGNSQTPISKRELEAEVQEAEQEIKSIELELKKLCDAGADDILERLAEIWDKITGSLPPGEDEKLRQESKILAGNPLYTGFMSTSLQLSRARARHSRAYFALQNLNQTLDTAEPPDIALLPGGSVQDDAR